MHDPSLSIHERGVAESGGMLNRCLSVQSRVCSEGCASEACDRGREFAQSCAIWTEQGSTVDSRRTIRLRHRLTETPSRNAAPAAKPGRLGFGMSRRTVRHKVSAEAESPHEQLRA